MTVLKMIGKGLLGALAAGACLLILTVPVLAQAPEETDAVYASTVHYQAQADSMSIGNLKDGTQVTVLEEQGDYYQIDCYEMKGYILRSQVEQKNGEYYVSCDPEASDSSPLEAVPAGALLSLRLDILNLAQAQLGVRYVYGGTTPNGFDCSGFTSYVFGNNDVSIRRTAGQQLQDTTIISRENLLPGDLLFFSDGSSFTSHVGIYVGGNQMIHAGGAGIAVVDLELDYFASTYLCARRILHADVTQSVAVSTQSSTGARTESTLQTEE